MRSENGEYSPTKAKALLDVFGYVDRNGDGWRERPDGTPLILEMASETDGNSRQYDELMQRNMKEIGLRIRFKVAQWPENAKAARAGKLTWAIDLSACSRTEIPGSSTWARTRDLRINRHRLGSEGYY